MDPKLLLFIPLAVIFLLVMVLIHELGHYLVGRWLGFSIKEFSVGFGPKIVQKPNKRGELVSLRWLPLGGYCQFYGEDADDPDPRAFNNQKPWKRILVLVAGGVFNILSAILFCVPLLATNGYVLPKIAIVHEGHNYEILQDYKNDVILAVNDGEIDFWHDLSARLGKLKEGEEFTLTLEHDGVPTAVGGLKKGAYTVLDENGAVVYERLSYKQGCTTVVADEQTPVKGVGVGISSAYGREVKLRFGQVVGYSFAYPFKIAWECLGALGGLFTGAVGLNQMSGPVSTIVGIADFANQDLRTILFLAPLLAVNLGVFNLLPVPALDGSKIVFVLIEMIRKKPVNRNVEAIIHLCGFAFLILFAVGVDLLHGITAIRGG
ncbi:MAG: site-2 protease family protein [Clostridiales bacterium]|jgi:regulator of sigma E protease|nr:site-2 protease family protein [Clostridiales bacterium]